jgi:vacuolar-type H+-ATPase subunit H
VSREDVLKRIREAEAERKRTEESALAEKEKLLQEARTEARNILEDAARNSDAAAAETMKAEAKRIAEERKVRVQSGEGDIARIREGGNARLASAVDKLMKEFIKQASG